MEQHYTFHHEWPVQIRFNDIDPMGHVNNATFQEYFDLGRMYYLNLLFDGQLREKGLTLIIASISTDFLKPIFLESKVNVQAKVYKLGNKSLNMIQQVVSPDGEVKAFSKSVMVCVQIDTNETCVIPDSWRKRVNNIEKGDL
jgi:acyl-CoA thioester hydrolase